MIQPHETDTNFPVNIADNVVTTTHTLWDVLLCSYRGDLAQFKSLVKDCPELLYAQYNYTPPVHFAVREGHIQLVVYLLEKGALDPAYVTYPFGDTLLAMAEDRGHHAIASLLRDYLAHPGRCRFHGENGKINYQRSETEQQFENAVDKGELGLAEELLQQHPEFIKNETFFWGEGILMMPAKDANKPMLEMLMRYGGTVPSISKWGRFYYFKHTGIAAYFLANGMSATHCTWHHVTLLHDMAQEGDLPKADLLVKHGADLNAIDEEYQSTPLGMAARWGRYEMVEYLLNQDADPNLSGAGWSTPLAWAEKKDFPEIAALLKKAGAK